ncbi:MAG: serpin family protein [Anaerolineales bacterium]
MKRNIGIMAILLVTLLWIPACASAAPAADSHYAVPVDPAEATAMPTASAPAQYQDVQSDLPRDLSPQVPDSDLAELVKGNTKFAFSLYKQIDSGEENLFYSPYSISLALSMTYAGAKDQTAGQMAQSLEFLLPPDRLSAAFNRLALELDGRSKDENAESDETFRLSVVNSLWGHSGTPFEQDFLDLLARNYGAGIFSVDFQKDPDAVRLAINDWVGRSTEQRIKEIIPVGMLDPLTRLVLANAVYFKAAWGHPFAPEDTRDGTFHLLDGRSVNVPMMLTILDLKEMQGDGYTGVELPYAGGQLSMMIILPDEDRFREMEENLDAGLIEKTYEAMKEVEFTAFTMPKFSFDWSMGLADGLQILGMEDAFIAELADFSGMDGARDLYLSAILHKAFISVDEQGTEAGASTVVIGTMGVPEVFSVDRPFIFVIRDNPTGTILFLGRVMNPS